jgi:hypothetical protein
MMLASIVRSHPLRTREMTEAPLHLHPLGRPHP